MINPTDERLIHLLLAACDEPWDAWYNESRLALADFLGDHGDPREEKVRLAKPPDPKLPVYTLMESFPQYGDPNEWHYLGVWGVRETATGLRAVPNSLMFDCRHCVRYDISVARVEPLPPTRALLDPIYRVVLNSWRYGRSRHEDGAVWFGQCASCRRVFWAVPSVGEPLAGTQRRCRREVLERFPEVTVDQRFLLRYPIEA